MLDNKIFFIYDQAKVQREHDDLSKAIVYFFPPSLDISRQCTLCGQLVGMFLFFTQMAGSPPIIYRLRRRKFALQQIGSLILVLGTEETQPNAIITRQLQKLLQLHAFYRGSISQLYKTDDDHSTDKTNIWQFCLEYVCSYGDEVAAAFESVPSLDLPRSASSVMLKASELLQTSRRQSSVLGGCIIYKKRVFCSQLSSEINRRLLIVRPQQKNLLCESIQTDYDLPSGVYLFLVHLTQDEYMMLEPHPDGDNQTDEEKAAAKQASMTRQHETELSSLQSDVVEVVHHSSGIDDESLVTTDLEVNAAEEDINDSGLIVDGSLQLAEYSDSSLLTQNATSDLDVSDSVVGSQMSGAKESTPCGTDEAVVGVDDHATGVGDDDPGIGMINLSTDELYGKVGRSINFYEDATEPADRGGELSCRTRDDDVPSVSADIVDNSESSSRKSVPEGHADSCILPRTGTSGDLEDQPLPSHCTCSASDRRTSTEDSEYCAECGGAKIIVSSAKVPSKPVCEGTDDSTISDQLVTCHLYVQLHSDVQLVLLLKENYSCRQLVRQLNSTAYPVLIDLCRRITICLESTSKMQAPSFNYNYLHYDNFFNHLTGKITMNSKHSWEKDFCKTAMLMHDEFNQSEDLKEVTLKSATSCVYSRQSMDQQTYFQEKKSPPIMEPLSKKDTSMCLDVKARSQLLKDHDIILD